MFDIEVSTARAPRAPVSVSEIDHALVTQLVVAWAGEAGEQRRLGWWRSDLTSTFGGQDLFRRLLPSTWEWAVLQAAREAARRKDAEFRRQDHDPDRILSLFSLGFELDERIEERFQDLKRSGHPPRVALGDVEDFIRERWTRERFVNWVQSHGDVETTTMPVGRRINGDPPPSLELRLRRLVGALVPLADTYPLPHFRRVK